MYTNRHSMQQYRADKLLKIRETKNSNVLNKLHNDYYHINLQLTEVLNYLLCLFNVMLGFNLSIIYYLLTWIDF